MLNLRCLAVQNRAVTPRRGLDFQHTIGSTIRSEPLPSVALALSATVSGTVPRVAGFGL